MGLALTWFRTVLLCINKYEIPHEWPSNADEKIFRLRNWISCFFCCSYEILLMFFSHNNISYFICCTVSLLSARSLLLKNFMFFSATFVSPPRFFCFFSPSHVWAYIFAPGPENLSMLNKVDVSVFSWLKTFFYLFSHINKDDLLN